MWLHLLRYFYFPALASSDKPCTEDFRGPAAWSEIEARHIKNFIRNKMPYIEGYITFHSYGQFWFVPYGYQRGQFPQNYKEMVNNYVFYVYGYYPWLNVCLKGWILLKLKPYSNCRKLQVFLIPILPNTYWHIMLQF